MSIFIKGMAMPTDCRECNFMAFRNTRGDTLCECENIILATNFKSMPFDGRPDWCPLVELPEKHGRLIDADAFAEFIEDAIKRQRYKYVTVDGALTVADVLTAVIDDLKGNTIVKYESNPTVIEAEDEE